MPYSVVIHVKTSLKVFFKVIECICFPYSGWAR